MKDKSLGRIGTVIKKNASFKGVIDTKESVKVCGDYIGEIFSNRTVYIDSTANIEGDINAESIIVLGKVKGNLRAKNRVHLSSTSKLEGDIYSPSFIIENGGVFLGSCSKE